jgi:hypothetical protein
MIQTFFRPVFRHPSTIWAKYTICKFFEPQPAAADVQLINQYWNWNFPQLSVLKQTGLSVQIICSRLTGKWYITTSQKITFDQSDNVHASYIPGNYMNLHCIILIPNRIILMHYRSKILLKVQNYLTETTDQTFSQWEMKTEKCESDFWVQ